MKHGIKPTRKQKILMIKNRLKPEEWLVIKNLDNELEIVHRYSKKTRKIIKKVMA